VDTHSTRFFYHQGIPHVSIACSDCGHMVFFNAGILGFKPDPPEEEIVPEDDAQSNEDE
jgi:RNase P subunit RPR2